MKKTARLSIAGLVLAGMLGAPASAFADDDVKVRRGGCSGRSDWMLRVAERDDDDLAVKFVVDGRRAGTRHKVRMYADGDIVYRKRTKAGPKGNITVRRILDDDDVDTVKVKARNLRTGEVCTGKVRVDDDD